MGAKANMYNPVILSLWKFKRFFKPYRNLSSMPLIYYENGIAHTTRDKSNVFAQHLSSFSEGFTKTQEEGTSVRGDL
jgi:hypothetical protein